MIIGAPSSSDSSRGEGYSPRLAETFAALRAEARGTTRPASRPFLLPVKEPRVTVPEGTASTLLKNNQKAEIGILAKQAYAKAVKHGLTDGLKETPWRHREAINACGLRISEASQQHYNELVSHFSQLAGQQGRAFGAEMRKGTDPLRIALFKLREELAKQGLADGYAASIAKHKFQVMSLERLSAKQVWVLVFDLRRIAGGAAGRERKAKVGSAKSEGSAAKPSTPAGRDYGLKPKTRQVDDIDAPF
jgi:hypothetical protein